ncbi:hypothetical protein Kfla_5797 [Kribbella flavida DSM 17836]|uniref:DUF3817 domain-containing protein n=1 Tax=Kribbella flavida (strain DSM 17836 / JCM 10339 / NBRC 14399) TaxID=479435 RepID=D2PQ99_KRIFD|nr:hypothetical protein [Kribbella flavida]ADB34801.1 hypothetical protein Kfla_5797 [Kribbella flavida DSM 17836]
MTARWTPLRIAATAEVVSLAVLFTNLFTVHWPAVSSLIGPTHGCCYLLVIILTAREPHATTRTKLTALIPAIGGLLVLRRLHPSPLGAERSTTDG